MRFGYHLDQITAVAEARVDVEKILNAIPVIGLFVAALLEYRAEPHGRDAEIFQITDLGVDAAERAALPAVRARFGPSIPAPRLAVRQRRTRGGAIIVIQQGPGR